MTPSFEMTVVEAGSERLPCVFRGPPDGIPLLILPPLFEEMNRTRRLLALTGARLAEHGVRSCLPDLPGTGDHEDDAGAMDWDRWRAALAGLSATMSATRSGKAIGPPHLFAVRGGALLADAPPGRSLYRLAPPAHGGKPLRDLFRARAAADREAGAHSSVATLETLSEAGDTIEAAGYALSPALAAALRRARLPSPAMPTRTVATAPGPDIEAVIEGAPVWRQAEPVDAAPMAAALAADMFKWITTCDRNGV